MSTSADLGPQFESYVAQLVDTGRVRSRNDVLREGVRLIEEREKRLATLDAAMACGLADADTGRVRPIRDIAARLVAKSQAMENGSRE